MVAKTYFAKNIAHLCAFWFIKVKYVKTVSLFREVVLTLPEKYIFFWISVVLTLSNE